MEDAVAGKRLLSSKIQEFELKGPEKFGMRRVTRNLEQGLLEVACKRPGVSNEVSVPVDFSSDHVGRIVSRGCSDGDFIGRYGTRIRSIFVGSQSRWNMIAGIFPCSAGQR